MALKTRDNNALELVDVYRRFGDFTAVDGLNLSVAQGEFLTLLGPSGCGKTTTLNMIAGFLEVTSGDILLESQPVADLPAFKRDTGMVFQDYALFPHMTVDQNVAFGLRMRKVSKAEIKRRVGRALEIVHLSGLGDRKPAEMSGGQKQRVALARALVIEPKVLLFDEPLSNLDLKLREAMRVEITDIQRELGITAIYVTHDQGEALVMSDRIAVMNKGRIEQLDVPKMIYDQPGTRFVADFIGSMNFVPAVVLARDGAQASLQTETGKKFEMQLPDSVTNAPEVVMAIRPERCTLSSVASESPDRLDFAGRVQQRIYLGSKIEYVVDVEPNISMRVEVPSAKGQQGFENGETVVVSAHPEDCVILPKAN